MVKHSAFCLGSCLRQPRHWGCSSIPSQSFGDCPACWGRHKYKEPGLAQRLWFLTKQMTAIYLSGVLGWPHCKADPTGQHSGRDAWMTLKVKGLECHREEHIVTELMELVFFDPHFSKSMCRYFTVAACSEYNCSYCPLLLHLVTDIFVGFCLCSLL